MTLRNGNLRKTVIEYCSAIGLDSLLVQGAGGNVSWKDKNTLWVKASGKCLVDALEKEIFIPVDLPSLLAEVESGTYAVNPKVFGETSLKPSIETLLHALMPHSVVVHLHAVEVLAHLVHDFFQPELQEILDEIACWSYVEYHKPGAQLAAAVNKALIVQPKAKVIFLQNHGLVLGGEDVTEVDDILRALISVLKTKPVEIENIFNANNTTINNFSDAYIPIKDIDIHQLALNSDLFNRLACSWALYPDHVVFLGPKAHAYHTSQEFYKDKQKLKQEPELIFIYGEGVFIKPSFSISKQVQLRCYYDVISRQKPWSLINVLANHQVEELLNWDAEKYRVCISQ